MRFSAILITLLLCTSFFWNRPFPKRLLGNYKAVQESYEVKLNNQPTLIPESHFSLRLNYDFMVLTSPQKTQKLTYRIKDKTKHHFNLEVTFDDGKMEYWRLYKKTKKISRSAEAPRPEVIFLKN